MNKRIVFWVDDERTPEWFFPPEFFDEFLVIWIKDYHMFEFYLTHFGVPEEIHFDHDLGSADEKSGYDCAKFLVEYCQKTGEGLPKVYDCHSANPAGHDNIMSILDSYKKSLEL